MSFDCHKKGFCLPLELCSLICIGDAFPWKAKARNVKQRILWTSSQRDTSSDQIHLCITQIFKVILPVLPVSCQKASPSRAVNSALQRATESYWKTSGGLLWKADPIAISSSFCISLPCSLSEKAFALIVRLFKKFSTPSTWKLWFSLEVISPETFPLHQLKSVQRTSAPVKG